MYPEADEYNRISDNLRFEGCVRMLNDVMGLMINYIMYLKNSRINEWPTKEIVNCGEFILLWANSSMNRQTVKWMQEKLNETN